MLKNFLSCDSFVRVNLENLFEKTSYFVVSDFSWDWSDLAALNFTEKVCFKFCKKWKLADHYYV